MARLHELQHAEGHIVLPLLSVRPPLRHIVVLYLNEAPTLYWMERGGGSSRFSTVTYLGLGHSTGKKSVITVDH